MTEQPDQTAPPLDILVLAAGLGTRMKSNLAKVLHKLQGRAIIAHVCRTATQLDPRRMFVIVGHQADDVRAAVEKELGYALAKKKLIIPIVEQGVHDEAFVKRLNPVFRFSRLDDPGKIETQVIEFLKHQKVAKENLQAVGALVAIGLGLLLLSELSRG